MPSLRRRCASLSRSLTALLSLVALATACRRGPPSAPLDASAFDEASRASDAASFAIDDASVDGADAGAPLHSCADPPDPIFSEDRRLTGGVRLDALVAVDRGVFSPDQRAPKGRWDYEAPPRIALERGATDEAPRLVMGDADLARCEILISRGEVQGPFAFVASSERWIAYDYAGKSRHVVVVRDGEGRVRGMRGFAVPPIGSGFTVARGEYFPDGAALVITSYVSADGMSDHAIGVYGFARGALAPLHETKVTVPPGALDVFALKHEASGDGTTLTITIKAHPAIQDEHGAMSKRIDRVRRVRWDARASVFR